MTLARARTKTKKPEVASDNVVTALRDEFLRRKAKNDAYSLNRFSKHLSIDQSMLSKILLGKKVISDRLGSRLLAQAGISRSESHSLQNRFNKIAEDEFAFLADWLPFAILELAKTKDFKFDNRWIAQRLGAHNSEVAAAVDKLMKFNYVKVSHATGELKINRPNNNWSNSKQTSIARKQLQRRLAEKSLQALDEVDFQDRDHGSLTVAISRKSLPMLKERLSEFRLELGNLMQDDESDLDEVYLITIAAIPLTRVKKGAV